MNKWSSLLFKMLFAHWDRIEDKKNYNQKHRKRIGLFTLHQMMSCMNYNIYILLLYATHNNNIERAMCCNFYQFSDTGCYLCVYRRNHRWKVHLITSFSFLIFPQSCFCIIKASGVFMLRVFCFVFLMFQLCGFYGKKTCVIR